MSDRHDPSEWIDSDWTDCWKCGGAVPDSEGCRADRRLTFADGTEREPVPYGEGHGHLTYDELLAHFDERISAGQWGPLSTSELIKEREQFVGRWSDAKAEFDDRPCRDCGVALGEFHHPGCPVEECPRCGDRYVECDCETGEKGALEDGS